MFNDYYEIYWKKRGDGASNSLINRRVPKLFVKYSCYGSILNSVPKGSKVIDLGCGDGSLSVLFKEFNNCDVLGVDISKTALKFAKKKGIKVKYLDLNNKLKFKQRFDTVVVVDVLEHIINPLSLLRDSNKLLKKGGRLVLMIPNFSRLSNRFKMLIGKPNDQLHWDKYGDGMEHLHWFTKGKLIYFLKQAGFKKVKFNPVGLPFDFFFGLIKMHGLSKVLSCIACK